jgi:nucleotide-binding universal stress UspA family protein
MGTHGRRGMKRLALGSDAELVVRHSPVPVLLVKPRQPPKQA